MVSLFVALSVHAGNVDVSRNNLGASLSPYLLQHRENPIHWQQWHEDVLAFAQAHNKPIFLSIGYASCHWCHVMEQESFVDPEVADVLNRHFVSIKVDREERPDIDAVHMMALQIMKGEGGWPINAFLTPDGKVFFVNSYMTKARFLKVSARLASIWKSNAHVLKANGDRLSSQVEKQLAFNQASDDAVLDISALIDRIATEFDTVHGGLNGAPKFPKESLMLFLLDAAQKTGDAAVVSFLDLTLKTMATSALYDPVSGGFFRYSVDAAWKTPHFEKMLYNQALMVTLYSRAYAVFPDPLYRRVVEQTIDFVERYLSGAGLYFASMDAVTDYEEGVYYLYSLDEINRILPKKFQALSTRIFDISHAGNFNGSNILRFSPGWQQVLAMYNVPRSDWNAVWGQLLDELMIIREQRPRPKVDKKAITSWNALWINALWEASNAFDRTEWRETAARAQETLLDVNREHGGLKRYSLNGVVGEADSTLEDYAFAISMLIAAYDNTAKAAYLKEAEAMFAAMKSHFYIKETGLWELYQNGRGKVPFPVQSLRDDNFVSAYGVVLQVIRQLIDRTGDVRYREYSANSLGGLSRVVKQPEEYASILRALDVQGLSGQQYFANGHGKVDFEVRSANDGTLDVIAKINMQEGWHINSNQPGKKALVATRMEVNGVPPVTYPNADVLSVSWSGTLINIWQGSVLVEVPAKFVGGQIKASLQMQACSDKLCLPAETIEYRVFE
ncbi:Uncharacterised protein [BD1-7 clade bacterium]|uniref:DUF255 domain-containing protein n=1 Tax=BD1-7 clade bacterium TaxID=2029982 RepID=A0A5S9PUZ5_9GAMM|nr:Uncharacterised protein [BD1-7 clade bacterium]